MQLKNLSLIFIFLGLYSCDFLKEKLFTESQIILVDSILDLSSVDVYPSFPACDSLIDSKLINACFKIQMHKYLSKELRTQMFNTTEYIDDTIQVRLLVNAYGETELLGFNTPPKIEKTLPSLDSVIHKSFQNIPRIRPALKRGVPVSVIYNLPIVVKTN